MDALYIVMFVLFGYVIGSIPVGYIVAKRKGIDIKSRGSGATGATNVKRVLGWEAAIFVAACDILKGLIPSAVAYWGFSGHSWYAFAAILGAGLGSVFSCFLSFKSGKGIAATFGGLIPVLSWLVLPLVAVWLVVVLLSHKVSLGGLLGLMLLVPLLWVAQHDLIYVLLGGVIIPLIVFSHRENIGRLIHGTELRA